GIGSSRQVGAAERRMRFQVAGRRAYFQPIGIFLEGGKKSGEPAILVTVLVRAGPDAEFFHIVAHGSNATWVSTGRIAEISDDVFDFAERDQIAESFLSGIAPHGLAAVFGDVGTKEFFGLEASGEEVHVINEGVGDVGGGEGR